MDKDVERILSKYKSKLDSDSSMIEEEFQNYNPKGFSREYRVFREETLTKRVSGYEKICNFIEKIIAVRPKPKEYDKLKRSVEISHLNITPIGASSFAVFIALLIILIAIFIGLLSFFQGELKLFFPLFLIIVSALLIKPLTNIPNYIADRWRLRASNQMVTCILYMVMYMRHTSNLENAIKFSADHIGQPLSLDLRKVFWDVESRRFNTIKESLDHYLETWRDYNLEFVNSFHLIESSLYEPNESRRVELLEKSLENILEGTYEKMLHYTHNLKNPITMLHMLGVILPILGLVMFPLIGSFLGGAIRWYHLAILYNIILPVLVISLGMNILSKRPTGYGESEFLVRKKGNLFLAALIISVFCVIGLLPLILYIGYDANSDPSFLGLGKFLDYKENAGPYGTGALILSLFIPLGLAIGLSVYYKSKTKDLIKQRNETKNLEKEFASSLFQLGNRIEEGIPAELAFEKVGENMHGTPTGNFFKLVSINLTNLGMDLKNAIFNEKNGAILQYPSKLIQTSMEVLIESSKKSARVVSQSLVSISNYIKNINTVNERLKDLLSDIISSMKSQISFLAPVIAGIVVGIASLIVNILGKLKDLSTGALSNTEEFPSGLDAITNLFDLKDVIPSYFFQLVVGLYLIEIVIILTILANSIENGVDKLNAQYSLAKNLRFSVALYILIALLVILIFNALAGSILPAIGTI